jgi:hypothetical protein
MTALVGARTHGTGALRVCAPGGLISWLRGVGARIKTASAAVWPCDLPGVAHGLYCLHKFLIWDDLRGAGAF